MVARPLFHHSALIDRSLKRPWRRKSGPSRLNLFGETLHHMAGMAIVLNGLSLLRAMTIKRAAAHSEKKKIQVDS